MGAADVLLRTAAPADMEKLFCWRNDPGIVALSGSQRPVSWQDHQTWFSKVLQNECHLLFVVMASGDEAGTVRFDRDGAGSSSATVTVYLMEGFRGRGIGTEAIERGCEKAFAAWPVLSGIKALIRQGNEPSIRAFRSAGFAVHAERQYAAGNTYAVRKRGVK